MESSTASDVSCFRVALANLRFPASPSESLELAVQAIYDAGEAGAGLVCFPECYVPGYRKDSCSTPAPDATFLDRAFTATGEAAAKAGVAVVLGCERIDPQSGALLAAAAVFQPDGALDGFQDKVQIDPSEEGTYTPGLDRCVFRAGPLTFGIAICHEGWRYPETVRFAARRGAHVVFHPHYHWAERPDSFRPTTFADPRNSFHEKAALCRAAENTCYFATVNYASEGSPTTSAVVSPDGALLCYQPYGVEGLLLADLDLRAATGLLASRCRTSAL